MEKVKLGFDDFMASVSSTNKEFVTGMHEAFTARGCKIEVKEAKSGYLVSYLLNKKTVANYVFRKAGLMIRIYANHIKEYMEFLETIPDSMVKTIEDASVCKRLINPNDCNPKCAMGYDFIMRGQRHQKCRNNAFMFLVCEENNDFIKSFVGNELNALG